MYNFEDEFEWTRQSGNTYEIHVTGKSVKDNECYDVAGNNYFNHFYSISICSENGEELDDSSNEYYEVMTMLQERNFVPEYDDCWDEDYA